MRKEEKNLSFSRNRKDKTRLNVDEKKRSNLEEIVNSKRRPSSLPQRQRDGSDTEKQNKDSLYDQPNRGDEASNKEKLKSAIIVKKDNWFYPPRASVGRVARTILMLTMMTH